MKQRKKGGFMMLLGLLLMAAAFVYASKNLEEERMAGEEAASVISQLRAEATPVGDAPVEDLPVIETSEPQIVITDAYGEEMDWPMHADGRPMTWPVDEQGEPYASVMDEQGQIVLWTEETELQYTEWQQTEEGGVVPFLSDGEGHTVLWPGSETGELMSMDDMDEEWQAMLADTLERFGDYASRPNFVRNPQMEMPTRRIAGHEYIGVLDIPSLEISLPVMSEWTYSKLKIAPCRYEGSAYSKDLIIMGHNYSTHLRAIKDMKPGDEVRFTDAAGNIFIYSVIDNVTLDKFDVAEMSAGDWDLTVFTCHIGGGTRATVRCRLESYICP